MNRTSSWVQISLLLGETSIFFFSGAFIYIVISRTGGAVLLGEYSIVIAWILLFQTIGSFGVHEFIMREIGRLGDAASKYVTHGLLIGVCASLLATVVMVGVVSIGDYSHDVYVALLIGALTLVPSAVGRICRGAFVARKRSEFVVFPRLLEFIVVVPINVYLIITDHGVRDLVITILAGRVLSSIAALLLLHSRTIPLVRGFDPRFCRQLIPPAFTFAMSESLGLLALHVNIIMLSLWASVSTVGYYSAASKLVEIMLLIPAIFVQYMLPQLAGAVGKDGRDWLKPYAHYFRVVFAISMIMCIGVFVFSELVVRLIFGPDFAQSNLILRLLLIFFVVQCADMHMSLILKAKGLQSTDVRLFSFNPVSNVLLNLVLIPTLGAVGAAFSAVSAVMVSLFLRFSYVTKSVIKLSWERFFVFPIIYGLAIGLPIVAIGAGRPGIPSAIVYVLLSSVFLAGLAWRAPIGGSNAGPAVSHDSVSGSTDGSQASERDE